LCRVAVRIVDSLSLEFGSLHQTLKVKKNVFHTTTKNVRARNSLIKPNQNVIKSNQNNMFINTFSLCMCVCVGIIRYLKEWSWTIQFFFSCLHVINVARESSIYIFILAERRITVFQRTILIEIFHLVWWDAIMG
jgi:hypothetical protein